MRTATTSTLLFVALTACGGDGEDVPDEILPASEYAARCQAPRKGTDPFTNAPFDDASGSTLDEQLWLRSMTDDLYLWYSEVPREDPRRYATALDYFDVEKTPALTASGAKKDRFHFTYTTSDWDALSTSGVEVSYGLQWVILEGAPPRKIVVAYIESDTPAAAAHLARGAEVISVDGVLVKDGAEVDTLNNGLSPLDVNETHHFMIIDQGTTTAHPVDLTSASIASVPVKNVQVVPDFPDVGYLTFNDHIATAEKGLINAVNQLGAAHVKALILDLRYNGGGYLDLAAELASMIAGPAATGKVFDRETFNDKHLTIDPVTGETLTPSLFPGKTYGFQLPTGDSVPAGQALPHLELEEVYVLTGPGTCSASEAVMNGLAGVGVKVIQIGDTTCGKPYGFYPLDNCGITYFTIQFQGVNAQGFGDYTDGFVPGGVLPGCVIDDDFAHQLGDPAEGLFAAALHYRSQGACPGVPNLRARAASTAHALVPKSIWRQNLILIR